MQKTILEKLFGTKLRVLIIYFCIIIGWFIYNLYLNYVIHLEYTAFYKSVSLITSSLYVIFHMIAVTLTFRLREIADNFLQSVGIEEKTRDIILSNFYNTGGNRMRIMMFIFIYGAVIWFVIRPIFMEFPEELPDQIIQIWICVGWLLLGLVYTDLIMAAFRCTFLPKSLLQLNKVPEPDVFHVDGNFGYSKFVDFSFKFYLTILVFCGVFLLLNITDLDPNQEVTTFTFKIWRSSVGVWIGANIFCLLVFTYSLNFYRKKILAIKEVEQAKISQLINKYIQPDQLGDYWKINNLIELRQKVIDNQNTPINTNTIKKIIVSLVSFLSTSILLPNFLDYLQIMI